MNLRLGLLFVVGVSLTGCEDDAFDPTEGALRSVSSNLRGIDQTVERATGFSFFGALRERVEEELVPFEDGRWVFPTGGGVVTIGFEEADGGSQQFPSAQTDGMEIAVIEDLDAGPFFDLPGEHTATATTSSATRGLLRLQPSISAAYAMEFEHDLHGVALTLRGEVEAELTFGGACPVGELSGRVTASATAPLQPSVNRTLEILARYDGSELVWQAYDGDDLLDEGRLPAAAASGC